MQSSRIPVGQRVELDTYHEADDDSCLLVASTGIREQRDDYVETIMEKDRPDESWMSVDATRQIEAS